MIHEEIDIYETMIVCDCTRENAIAWLNEHPINTYSQEQIDKTREADIEFERSLFE